MFQTYKKIGCLLLITLFQGAVLNGAASADSRALLVQRRLSALRELVIFELPMLIADDELPLMDAYRKIKRHYNELLMFFRGGRGFTSRDNDVFLARLDEKLTQLRLMISDLVEELFPPGANPYRKTSR